MMRRLITLALSLSIVSMLANVAIGNEPKNFVKGTLTVNNETHQIQHAYVHQEGEEVAIFLFDNPIPPEKIPWEVGDLAYDNDDLHGLSVGVLKSTKQPNPEPWFNAIYHKVWMGRLALLEPGNLQITRLDNDIIEGRWMTDEPVTLSDNTYSYDVTFKLSIETKAADTTPAEVSVTGDDTPPAKVYSSYYKAKMAGDLEAMKKLLAMENAKNFDSDIEMIKMSVEMAMMNDPREIEIAKTDISGDTASLTVKGMTNDGGEATGNVKMVFEDGQWKVFMDKWEIVYR